MTLLITGGTGFVLSNLARRWLEENPNESVLALDAAPWDAALERFFAPVRERLIFIQGDVLDQAVWDRLAGETALTHVVHGATITPSAEREKAQPKQILEVNVMGTVNALEFARRLPHLRRFIYVSSGAVYGEARARTPDVPVPEDGHVSPVELYGISKYASEHITRRYGEVFGLSVASVRFSGVYGPMDRETPARAVQCIPYRVAHLALAGQPIRVNALEAGGDWIHAQDVARALAVLLRAPKLNHGVYNIAYGGFITIGELIEIVREVAPGLRASVVPEAEADIVQDPRKRLGRWSDYDVSRLRGEFGWAPRPIREALQSYVTWLRENEFSTTQ
ncbi:MAG: NAD-dependent epimerase/dehydratase family protein [Anaerolineales bacterium]